MINYDEADTRYAQLSGASFTGNVTFGDNDKAIFGAGSDLQIYHNGSNSIVADTGSGNLSIQTNGVEVALWDAANGQYMGDFNVGGEVGLYYDGSKKLATTSGGIDVTGTVTADGLTVDGDATVQTTSGNTATFLLGQSGVRNWRFQNAATSGTLSIKPESTKSSLSITAGNDISFYDNTGTTPELFWDASAERLGIGTTSPARELSIGDGTGSPNIQLLASNVGNSRIEFGDTDDSDAGEIQYDHTGNFMRLYTGGSERMRIDSSGNVGIGTDAPSAMLDIAGDAEINSLTVGRGPGNFGTNTAVGASALEANTTGTNNTAVGYRALYSNTEGGNNLAVGRDALYSNTTGTNNTASGRETLYSNTTGTNNVASGYRALYSNTTGVANTATGQQALNLNTTGDNNTAVGFQALNVNTEGTNNAANGYQALRYNTTGDNNVANGYRALFNNTTGLHNVAAGTESGEVITTGSRNTILGSFADPSAEDGNDQVVLGYNLTGKGDETAFIGGTNGAYNEKNVTTWETTSDQRIKKNIVNNDDGLSVLSQIQVRNFEYRTPDEITDLPSHAAVEHDGVQLGVIAQEIQQVLPECVSENSTGVLSVNTDPLVWYLINAVKELKAEIEQLKGN